MNNIRYIFFLALIVMLSANTGYAQKKEQYIADSLFRDLQFNIAAENYDKALRKMKGLTPEKLHCTYNLAECYRLMNDPDLAEPYYRQLAETSYGDTVPVYFLRYATILKTRGDAESARNYFEKYLQTDPGNKEAETGLRSCDWLIENRHKKAQVIVEEITRINTLDDEFGPAYLNPQKNSIIFTSNRVTEDSKNIDQWTGSRFSDLYISAFDGKNWSDPELAEYGGLLNSDVHEGTPSLNGDYSVMYYTRCGKTANVKSFCEIWKTVKTGDQWSKPAPVLTDSVANIGHPAISKDERILIFSSNRPGGTGGKDLWAAKRNSADEPFGRPELLGPGINTAGDELFPYLYNDTTLLFASNGYEGYGGLDIFISYFRKNKWTKPENLLAPINSSYDDFGIILKKPFEEGCFCSNRNSGTGGDDIYHFYRRILLFTASGQVKDNSNLLSVRGAEVILTGNAGDTVKVMTDKQGVFRFDNSQVKEDVDYELVFRKQGYFSKKETFSTRPYEEDHDFSIDIKIDPIPEKPIVLPDILYELDKWDLAPQYQDSLLQLVRLLKDNETLVIELRSHTDSRGSAEYNNVLSQKRAQSVVDFIVSQGIDPGRLVAKGYGKRIFRMLDKDIVKDGYTFKAGTELNDDFVNRLPSKEAREAAYQLNRRTEFAVIAKDYKPGSSAGSTAVIEVISDTSLAALDYNLTPEGKMAVEVYINDYSAGALIDRTINSSLIDEKIVLDLLQKGAIDRNDFQGVFEQILIDDRITENTVILLRKIRLGGIMVGDHPVKVISDAGNKLIIGNDLLEKAGSFIIDESNKKLIFK